MNKEEIQKDISKLIQQYKANSQTKISFTSDDKKSQADTQAPEDEKALNINDSNFQPLQLNKPQFTNNNPKIEELEHKVENLEEKLTKLRATNERLEAEKDEVKPQNKSELAELSNLQKDISLLKLRNLELNNSLNSKELEIKSLKESLNDLATAHEQKSADLKSKLHHQENNKSKEIQRSSKLQEQLNKIRKLQTDKIKQQNEDLKRHLSNLETELSEKENRLARLNHANKELLDKNEDIEHRYYKLRGSNASLQEDYLQLNSNFKSLAEDIELKNEEVIHLKRELEYIKSAVRTASDDKDVYRENLIAVCKDLAEDGIYLILNDRKIEYSIYAEILKNIMNDYKRGKTSRDEVFQILETCRKFQTLSPILSNLLEYPVTRGAEPELVADIIDLIREEERGQLDPRKTMQFFQINNISSENLLRVYIEDVIL